MKIRHLFAYPLIALGLLGTAGTAAAAAGAAPAAAAQHQVVKPFVYLRG